MKENHKNGFALTMVLASSCLGWMQLFLPSQRIPDTLNKRSEGTLDAGVASRSCAKEGKVVK